MTGSNGRSPAKAKYKIVFEPLDENTPGFLRIQKKALTLAKAMRPGNIEPETIDDMVEFLLPFVTEPVDRDEAREAIWDCTRKQWEDMLNAIMGNVSGAKEASGAVVPTE